MWSMEEEIPENIILWDEMMVTAELLEGRSEGFLKEKKVNGRKDKFRKCNNLVEGCPSPS